MKIYRGGKEHTREEQSGHDDGKTNGTIAKKLMRAAMRALVYATAELQEKQIIILNRMIISP